MKKNILDKFWECYDLNLCILKAQILINILALESPLRWWKLFLISPCNFLSLSRYICLDFSVMQKNDLIRKIRLISKFMASKPWKRTIAMHILPSISRSNDNQTRKFGQLIEYKMRNIFLETSYTKCCGETIPRPFSKKSKLSIFLHQ